MPTPSRLRTPAAALLLCLLSAAVQAVPAVVTSILPLHGLVSGVMQGVGKPRLLIGAWESPHNHQLRPSELRALRQADLLVWVGADLESALARSDKLLPAGATNLPVAQIDGMLLLESRDGEAGHAGHAHGSLDPHLWLAPRNAQLVVARVASELARLDPGNAAAYRRNANAMRARIDALEETLREQLARVPPFLTYHDAYQYFETSFGLQRAGSVTTDHNSRAGARRVAALRDRVAEGGIRCIFHQFRQPPALVDVLLRARQVPVIALDPMGNRVTPGPEAWFDTMRALGAGFARCAAQADDDA